MERRRGFYIVLILALGLAVNAARSHSEETKKPGEDDGRTVNP